MIFLKILRGVKTAALRFGNKNQKNTDLITVLFSKNNSNTIYKLIIYNSKGFPQERKIR